MSRWVAGSGGAGGVVEYDDAAMRYPRQDKAAVYVGQVPPPEDRAGLYVYRPPVEPAIRYFTGLWRNPLAANAPLEDRAAYNGTDDATNNRANTPYATRLAHIATYSTVSTPVAGLYARGDNTIMATDAAPLYIIPTANHPRQRVWFVQNGTVLPDSFAASLPTKFLSVPVPCGPAGQRFETYYGRTIEAAGSDKQAVFYDPSTGEMWEVFGFSWNATASRYEAIYGGYVPDARTAPEALPNSWGGRATSLPVVAANLLRVEWEEGVIRHPIGVGIPVVKPGFLAPATRQDNILNTGTPADYWHTAGNDGRDAVPEGAFFRLPASYVIDENKYPASPAKSKMFAMLTRAARDYGLIISDGTGGSMTVGWEAPNAVGTPYSPITTSTLPVQADYNAGPYYGNGSMLAYDFPWSQLVQVKYISPSA